MLCCFWRSAAQHCSTPTGYTLHCGVAYITSHQCRKARHSYNLVVFRFLSFSLSSGLLCANVAWSTMLVALRSIGKFRKQCHKWWHTQQSGKLGRVIWAAQLPSDRHYGWVIQCQEILVRVDLGVGGVKEVEHYLCMQYGRANFVFNWYELVFGYR